MIIDGAFFGTKIKNCGALAALVGWLAMTLAIKQRGVNMVRRLALRFAARWRLWSDGSS